MICIKLLELLKGVCIVRASSDLTDVEINRVKENSSAVEKGDLFIAMAGSTYDGTDYIAQAVLKGASCIVLEGRGDHCINADGVCFIQVNNVRRACATIWSNYYGNPEKYLRLIGVTGTNGKTTVCKMIQHIFGFCGEKCGIIGTVGNGIGDNVVPSDMTTPAPKEFFRLLDEYRKCGAHTVVLEASSHALKQERLSPCLFDVGILTNITSDHLDFHKTKEDYISSKCKLFTQSKISLLNADDPSVDTVCSRIRGVKRICSINGVGDVNVKCVTDNGFFGSEFEYNGIKVRLPLAGIFNVYNAMQAIAACEIMGISAKKSACALECMPCVKGRCEVQRDLGVSVPFTVVIDFAHTPDALENILKICKSASKGRLITVFGCGGERDKTKRSEMGRIASRLSDLTVITSDNSRSEDPLEIIKDILKGIDKNSRYTVIQDRTDAIKYALDAAKDGDVVLLAGKGHEEYEINSQGVHPYSERKIVREYLINKYTKDS